MTDADFLLHVLSDGLPHHRDEIVRRSFVERGCGLTPHSRAPELRRRGYDVQVTAIEGAARRQTRYQIVGWPDGCVETSGGSGDLLSPAGVSTEPPGATSGASPAFTLAGDAGSQVDGQLVLTGSAFRKAEAA